MAVVELALCREPASGDFAARGDPLVRVATVAVEPTERCRVLADTSFEDGGVVAGGDGG
jgi:hypothetical protein